MNKESNHRRPEVANTSIVEQIASMYSQDQEIRQQVAVDPNQAELCQAVDQENTKQLKTIVDQIGWPTASKVGEQAANQAWLLVQHADHDVSWQKECLALMKDAAEDEVQAEDIAYLEDRIRVNEGRPQLYGTQFHEVDGKQVLQPIEDEANVDDRRTKAGMEPLAEYQQGFLNAIKKKE